MFLTKLWRWIALFIGPEAPEPIRGLEAFKHALERILQVYSEFTTTIHDLVAEEDRVACRLSHRAVNRLKISRGHAPVVLDAGLDVDHRVMVGIHNG